MKPRTKNTETGFSILVSYIAADVEEAARIRSEILNAIIDVPGLMYSGGLLDVSQPARIVSQEDAQAARS